MNGTTVGFVELVRAAVAAGRPARVPVTGASMLPALRSGVVLVEPVHWGELRPGDVVAYEHERNIVVRRLVAQLGDRLLTAGDNLPLYDPPVPRHALVGRVSGVPDEPPSGLPDGLSGRLGPRGGCGGRRPVPPLRSVTLWLAGAAARTIEERDHPAPETGVLDGVLRVRHLADRTLDPERLARAVHALPGTTVGISATAVRGVAGLRTGLTDPGPRATAGLDIVLGCRYAPLSAPHPRPDREPPATAAVDPAAGGPVADRWQQGEPLLPADAVRHHLRVGPPLCDIPAPVAVRAVLAAFGVGVPYALAAVPAITPVALPARAR
ncbi:S26 family signal peptidase [Plantactinospora sp. B5E13]|uniref:S26 family signal peptidase n=1 Tax=Plantactinospora sp. B5E13 TaxID=3153758 RepID=UPI00325F73F2